MNINEYFERYTACKKAAAALGKSMECLKFKMGGSLVSPPAPRTVDKMQRDYITQEALRKSYEKKKRILARAGGRINEALKTTRDEFYRNFIICKYIYGMKYADIAENLNYCERHIYRLANSAKREFGKQLCLQMPRPVRGPRHKAFRLTESGAAIADYITSGYTCSITPESASKATRVPSGNGKFGVV